LARDWHVMVCSRFISALEDRAEMVGGRPIGFLGRVDIKGHCDGRGRVPEPGLNGFDILSSMQQGGGAGVPLGMAGRQAVDLGAAHDLAHPQRQALR
jgi:hypothetical protein